MMGEKIMFRAVLAASAALMLCGPAMAGCYGSDSFYSCNDGGNHYTVNRYGDTTTMRGYNAETGSTWSQRSSTYGGTTTTNGYSADGDSWSMRRNNDTGAYSGWDSDGNFFSGRNLWMAISNCKSLQPRWLIG